MLHQLPFTNLAIILLAIAVIVLSRIVAKQGKAFAELKKELDAPILPSEQGLGRTEAEVLMQHHLYRYHGNR